MYTFDDTSFRGKKVIKILPIGPNGINIYFEDGLHLQILGNFTMFPLQMETGTVELKRN